MEDSKGEIFTCDKCGGDGKIETRSLFADNSFISTCKKCKGTGKLDWIENVVGKKPEKINIMSKEMMKHMSIDSKITKISASTKK